MIKELKNSLLKGIITGSEKLHVLIKEQIEPFTDAEKESMLPEKDSSNSTGYKHVYRLASGKGYYVNIDKVSCIERKSFTIGDNSAEETLLKAIQYRDAAYKKHGLL